MVNRKVASYIDEMNEESIALDCPRTGILNYFGLQQMIKEKTFSFRYALREGLSFLWRKLSGWLNRKWVELENRECRKPVYQDLLRAFSLQRTNE